MRTHSWKGYKIREGHIKGRHRAVGLCDWAKREIVVDPRQSDRDFFDTLIHEHVHRLCPYWTEDRVLSFSTDLAGALLRAGVKPRPEDH